MRSEHDKPDKLGNYDLGDLMDLDDITVIPRDRNEESFKILKELSDSTVVLLKAMKKMENNIESLKKERKSDHAVIHKLLRDIKNLKSKQSVKTTPTQPKRKRIWREVVSTQPFKKNKRRKNVINDGWKRFGKGGQSGSRYRKVQSPVHMEVEVDIDLTQSPIEIIPEVIADMLVEVAFNEKFTQMDENDLRIETSKRGIVRKREGISPEEKRKKLIQDDGIAISVIRIPKKKKSKFIPKKQLSDGAKVARGRLDKFPKSIEGEGDWCPVKSLIPFSSKKFGFSRRVLENYLNCGTKFNETYKTYSELLKRSKMKKESIIAREMNFIAYAARIRDACYMQPDLDLYDYLKFAYENTTE